MNNFKKRLGVSLLAFPLIYILLYQKTLSNLLILIVFLFCIFEWVKIFKRKNAIFFLGSIVLLVFLLSLLRIYNFEEFNLTFLWLIVLTWLSDIGGYIFGKLFGGPKLTQISPNKTWAGAIGSIILSQFAFLIFFLNSDYKFNITIIFMQLFLSIIGQFGDILMSYVKRKNNKKDTSNFIPGHGGFLDRVDGLIWIIIFGNFFI
ncbi:CdsA CDP-diglyceride synthetase [Candidatus Pelagibacterales bacterium]